MRYMKELLGAVIFAAVAGCFTGCGGGGGEFESDDDGKTCARFDNTANVFPVSAYSDSLRSVKLADIAVGETKRIEVLPSNTGTAFYMTYHITVEGISFPIMTGILL
ncbi:MAG: hypothetical protein LBD13_05330 [Spirochaetaceae bacterium]|nr:hypothetical protein [Spirochaetaceae bacterium]